MKSAYVFQRNEYKYLINDEQLHLMQKLMKHYARVDEYGKSTIMSLYYDTPDKLLIRRSIDKPMYKEKLRLRSYGVPSKDTQVFVELKKKYDGVVFKRRFSAEYEKATRYLSKETNNVNGQIESEISYVLDIYQGLQPSMLLSYDRLAYYDNHDDSLRITFDTDITWRDYDLDLSKGIYGNKMLKDGITLMEIKGSGSMPMWLVHALSENKIYPSSFSKYGTAYVECQKRQSKRLREVKPSPVAKQCEMEHAKQAV